jgi:hypothetical protein
MARAQVSLVFVSKLEDDWFGPKGQQLRSRVAKHILEGTESKSADVYELLVKLERIGLLVETGALDREVVWSELSSTVLNYYPACQSIIEGYRKDNTLAWSNFTRLHQHMQRIERKRGGSETNPSREQWQNHLKSDIELAACRPEEPSSNTYLG